MHWLQIALAFALFWQVQPSNVSNRLRVFYDGHLGMKTAFLPSIFSLV